MHRQPYPNVPGDGSASERCAGRGGQGGRGRLNVTNGRDGLQSPANAIQRQTKLLDILDWFSKWEALHNEVLDKGEATEFNFVADETFFYIRTLILAHVSMIEIYCIQRKEEIRPRSMNTDTVE